MAAIPAENTIKLPGFQSGRTNLSNPIGNPVTVKKPNATGQLVSGSTGGTSVVPKPITNTMDKAAGGLLTDKNAAVTGTGTTNQSGYVVGAGYSPDTSAYAGKKDKNSLAAQMYDKQLEAYQRALQAAYDAQAASNRHEAQKLKGQYDASRSDVYTNSRLSAIGNNERLAALGLAGNMYDYARSGTSETSRIGQDIAMRKSLAGLDQSENEARGDLALALLMAQKEADANYANKVAEIEAAKIPYLTSLARGGGGGRSRSSSGSGGGGGEEPYEIIGGWDNKDRKAADYAGMDAEDYSTREGDYIGNKDYDAARTAARLKAALEKAKEAARSGKSAADSIWDRHG